MFYQCSLAPKKGITAQLEMEAKEMQKLQDQKKKENQNDLDSDRDTDGEEKKTEVCLISEIINSRNKFEV